MSHSVTAPWGTNHEKCSNSLLLHASPWYSRFRFELQTESYSTYSTSMWHQAAHLQDTATQPPFHFPDILCLLPQPPTHKNVGDASVPEAMSWSHSVGLIHCHINFKEHMFLLRTEGRDSIYGESAQRTDFHQLEYHSPSCISWSESKALGGASKGLASSGNATLSTFHQGPMMSMRWLDCFRSNICTGVHVSSHSPAGLHQVWKIKLGWRLWKLTNGDESQEPAKSHI